MRAFIMLVFTALLSLGTLPARAGTWGAGDTYTEPAYPARPIDICRAFVLQLQMEDPRYEFVQLPQPPLADWNVMKIRVFLENNTTLYAEMAPKLNYAFVENAIQRGAIFGVVGPSTQTPGARVFSIYVPDMRTAAGCRRIATYYF